MELTNRENWRSINLYLNYEVSSIGRVRNVDTGLILKPYLAIVGYYVVNLCSHNKAKQHKIHRLVAEAFITNLDDKPIVDHVDGVKTNNVVSNLRWATYSENGMNQKAQQTAKSSKYKGVSFVKQSNKWLACIMIDKKKNHLGYFSKETEAAQRYNEEAIKLFGEFVLINKIE